MRPWARPTFTVTAGFFTLRAVYSDILNTSVAEVSAQESFSGVEREEYKSDLPAQKRPPITGRTNAKICGLDVGVL